MIIFHRKLVLPRVTVFNIFHLSQCLVIFRNSITLLPLTKKDIPISCQHQSPGIIRSSTHAYLYPSVQRAIILSRPIILCFESHASPFHLTPETNLSYLFFFTSSFKLSLITSSPRQFLPQNTKTISHLFLGDPLSSQSIIFFHFKNQAV